MMLRRLLLIGLAVAATPAWAQTQPQPLLDILTQGDASRGIREALSLAATNATHKLAQPDGFFADPQVRIPLPGTLGQAQRGLRGFGLSGPLDDLERSINRGAEAAMPEAAGLFVDAVRSMTLGDAIQIVRGPSDAATQYLRGRTETRLNRLLKPIMADALDASGAYGLIQGVARELRMTSAARSLRGDVTDFSCEKALDGAFHYIAQEEQAIRRDPARRTSDILRRVFGAV